MLKTMNTHTLPYIYISESCFIRFKYTNGRLYQKAIFITDILGRVVLHGITSSQGKLTFDVPMLQEVFIVSSSIIMDRRFSESSGD